MIKLKCVAAVLLAATLPAWAQVQVTDPWVRGTVAGQMATGAFMTLTTPTAARLVGASSPLAGVVEIHEMTLAGNLMKMRAVEALELPAGRAVQLKPGGYHVMLMDLKRPLKDGEKVPLTLTVERAGKRESIDVQAPVRALTATAPAQQ
jgi:copper(I)-binding protein